MSVYRTAILFCHLIILTTIEHKVLAIREKPKNSSKSKELIVYLMLIARHLVIAQIK